MQQEDEAIRKAAAAGTAAASMAEADRLAVAKAEADRVAAGKAEADRLAAAKAEADRLATAQAEAEAKKQHELAPSARIRGWVTDIVPDFAQYSPMGPPAAAQAPLAALKAEAERVCGLE